LGSAKSGKAPPLLAVSAQQTEGLDELVDTIEQLSTSIIQCGRHQELRQMRLVEEIKSGIVDELWQRYLKQSDAERVIDDAAMKLAASGGSAYKFVREMCSSIQLTVDPKANA
jgi:putative protein kinase ArgK-like GTPase of G3E family